jgi:DNA-binding HxlR family transcriptional regulator
MLGERTVRIISGRWKIALLGALDDVEQVRFMELSRRLPGISARTLVMHLRNLEREGIVRRHSFAEAQPRVQYSLTESGRSLKNLLEQIQSWESGMVEAESQPLQLVASEA